MQQKNWFYYYSQFVGMSPLKIFLTIVKKIKHALKEMTKHI